MSVEPDFVEGATVVDEFDTAAALIDREERVEAEARSLLRQRQDAYMRTFRTGGATRYDAAIVFADLAKFCRMMAPTTVLGPDGARLSTMLEGRREVFLRIAEHTDLKLDEIVSLYQRGSKGL